MRAEPQQRLATAAFEGHHYRSLRVEDDVAVVERMRVAEGPYELMAGPDGVVARIRARGAAVLTNPMINRGTAFTEREREELGLTGLLPVGVTTIEMQLRRSYAQYSGLSDALARNRFLADLRDRNIVLFYRLLAEYIEEMLPVVYTPTIGEAIEQYNSLYRRPGGVYLSVDHPEDIEASFRNLGLGPDDVDLLVCTDAEGILGIGDQGVGGIEIAIGKLSVYAAAGMHPHRMIPVMLDVGTDNPRLLDDEMYLGNRHARVRAGRYDEFIDAYVECATRLYPHALLHWEDLGAGNARRVLERHSEHCCTFNDDMQGTAAVVLAAVISAVRASGGRLSDQRVVIHGAGTAGLGIADALRDEMVSEGLPTEEATRRFWPLGRQGLLTDAPGGYQYEFQRPYARPVSEVAGWLMAPSRGITLAEVVARVQPTVLVGTSTQAGAFTEAVVGEMAAHAERPIILPLSNPTSRSEALPADLIRWTEGRALIATGSPFPPVDYDGVNHHVAQANNALVFPGIGIGVAVARASRVTNRMLAAAARALAAAAPTASGAPLLPPVRDLRSVSAAVAVAVATTAAEEGVANRPLIDPILAVHEAMWRPEYPAIAPRAPMSTGSHARDAGRF